MADKTYVLDVDFIGGQDPLTVSEEKELSDYFKKAKAKASEKSGKRNTARTKPESAPK